MTLQELAAREEILGARVALVMGTMEAKKAALATQGVYAEYADILDGYVALFGDSEVGQEALTRAVFLVWYSEAEPSCFSGLGDLPASAVNTTLAELNLRSARRTLTPELVAMLGWYLPIADYVFAEGGPWPALARQLERTDQESWQTEVSPPGSQWSRGQLSVYWASILKVP